MKAAVTLSAVLSVMVAGPVRAQSTPHGPAQGGSAERAAQGRCIAFEKVDNRIMPIELYRSVGACIRGNRYADAVALFALAGMDIRYDVARVADNSVGDTGAVLIMETFQGMPQTAKRKFSVAIRTVATRPVAAYVCKWVRQVGPPTYYPEYMIVHGINAVTSALHGTPLPQELLPVSDPAARWQTIGESYLHCPSAAGAASRQDAQAATRYRATIAQALSKAAQQPAPAN
jgi:hypothetical protein